jgi:ketosteroid isomerase-like protein
MKSMITALLLLAAPAAAQAHDGHAPAAAAPARVAPAAADGPVAVVDAFHAALKRGDADAAAALLDEHAIVYEQGGVERTKAQYVAAHLPADAQYSKAMEETVVGRENAVSGAVAWVITDGRTRGTYEGRPVDRATTETMILHRTPAGWRIVHVHWSSGR